MIEISLTNEQTAFLPGDLISGTVRWTDIQENPKQIDIRLIWYTKGKGQQNHGVFNTVTVATPQNQGESGFQFTAPHRPFSFSGKLISLVWAIEVVVFPDLEAERSEVVISKDGKEILLN
jgi:hypothetical protein